MRKVTRRKHQPASTHALYRTLDRANTRQTSRSQQIDLELAAESVRSKFTDGTATADTFVDLNHINILTWQMGRQIAIHRKNEETGDIALLLKDVSERCADVLIDVGHRSNRTGKFGLTGDELKAIDEMLDLHRQAIGVLTQGMLTVAMIDAEGMVNAEIARAKEPTAYT